MPNRHNSEKQLYVKTIIIILKIEIVFIHVYLDDQVCEYAMYYLTKDRLIQKQSLNRIRYKK